MSTTGTVPYGTCKYLVEIVQPTLNKNIHRVINSYSFVQEAKTCEIYQDKVQVSYNVVNLYPSVPVDKATNVLIDTVNNNKEHLKDVPKLIYIKTDSFLYLVRNCSIIFFILKQDIKMLGFFLSLEDNKEYR